VDIREEGGADPAGEEGEGT
jgi:hypothetical protein